MKERSGRTYVLVAGAWHGGWIWRDVAERLRVLGHGVTTPTLAGLGERRHLGAHADLDSHVEDVVAHIEMEDLQDITLVGWSYGGMVTTGVLARCQHKIKAMIYLDAFVPKDGEALIDYQPPERVAAWDKFRREDKPLPPPPLETIGLSDPELQNLIRPKLVAQPWRTVYQPAKALKQWPDMAISYIQCTGEWSSPFGVFMEKMRRIPQLRSDVIVTGHFPMLTEPARTVELLHRYGYPESAP